MTPFQPAILAIVASGGAAGSLLRYAVGIWCAAWFGTALPWGTLAVNVVGSGAIGLLGGLGAGSFILSQELRLLLITGFLGGFTTFSAFSLEFGLLMERSPLVALGYLIATLGLGFGAFAITFWLGKQL